MATQKRNRADFATLEQYSDGKNPYFCVENNTQFVPDPRLEFPVNMTKSRNDQMCFDMAYHDENILGFNERFEQNPDSVKMEYKSINGPIVKSIVSFQEKGKKLSLLSPLSKVLVSTVAGSVYCAYEQEMKTVPIPPNDYEAIINKTEWKLILTETSYETKEVDGDGANEFNISFLEYAQALRKFEELLIRDIARRMISSYDKDTAKPKFLPELAFTRNIRNAIKSQDVDALAKEIFDGPFKSVYRQATLLEEEIDKVKELYAAKHGESPSEDYLEKNIKAAYSSGKVTLSTKQFQKSLEKNPKPVDMKMYPQHAKDICEANPGVRWCPFSIHKTTGSGIIPFNEDFKISRGDIIAPFFTPSFVVYMTDSKIRCGLKLQLNQKILYHRKAPEYVGGSNFNAKKLKFSVEDDDAYPTTGAAHALPESSENFGDEY